MELSDVCDTEGPQDRRNQFEVPMQVESHQPKDDSFTVESQMQGVVLAVVREFGQKAAAAGL
jgi:hypothetical protein